MPKEIKKSLQWVRELSKKAFHVLKDIELFWRCFEQAWRYAKCLCLLSPRFAQWSFCFRKKIGLKIVENIVQKYNYDCFLNTTPICDNSNCKARLVWDFQRKHLCIVLRTSKYQENDHSINWQPKAWILEVNGGKMKIYYRHFIHFFCDLCYNGETLSSLTLSLFFTQYPVKRFLDLCTSTHCPSRVNFSSSFPWIISNWIFLRELGLSCSVTWDSFHINCKSNNKRL